MKKNIKKQLLILILLICCIGSIAITFGRYVSNSISNFFIRSKEFYFNADKLAEDVAIYQIDNWSGVDTYTINVTMDSRKNNIKATTYDIPYDISYSVSNNALCQLSKNSGTILANTNSDSFDVIVTPNAQLNTGDRVEVEITATSRAQYKKTLKGRFTLIVGKEQLSYEITDAAKSPYCELRLTNTVSYYTAKENVGSYSAGDKINSDEYLRLSDTMKSKFVSSTVKIEFDPNEVLLDITNENYNKFTDIQYRTINGVSYIRSFKIAMDASSSMDIRFYKVDVNENYSYHTSHDNCILQIT